MKKMYELKIACFNCGALWYYNPNVSYSSYSITPEEGCHKCGSKIWIIEWNKKEEENLKRS